MAPFVGPVAWVVDASEHQLKVRCPWCQEFHYHGLGLGWRVPHCGYSEIAKLDLPQYELRLAASLVEHPAAKKRVLTALERGREASVGSGQASDRELV